MPVLENPPTESYDLHLRQARRPDQIVTEVNPQLPESSQGLSNEDIQTIIKGAAEKTFERRQSGEANKLTPTAL